MTQATEHRVDYKRQSAIASPRLMAETSVAICGMGTVGSNSAYQLARLGTKVFHLIDFDKVEAHNLPSQQFFLTDIGRYKAEAARDQIIGITNDADIELTLDPLAGGEDLGADVVILGVDNMQARRDIFDLSAHMIPSVKRVIDVRMAGNHMQVFSIDPCNESEVEKYRLFDFNDEDAHELPCGGESVSYVGAMSGAMVANVVRQHVMGERVSFMVRWNLGNWTFQEVKGS